MPRKKSGDNPICMTPGCGRAADALLAFDNGTTSWHFAECMSPVTPEEDIADLEALFKLGDQKQP
jgi:hypothetical protein